MTYAELKRQILNLGFETAETYEEEPSIMVDAINRAMREITNQFPLIGKYKIAQNPLPNLLPSPREGLNVKHYDGTTPLTFCASGAKALYFECSGTGELRIKDDLGERSMNLASSRAFKEYRAFVSGEVRLTFLGPFSYDIQNIALYGEVYSAELKDIPPHRKFVRYDFRELTAQNGTPVFIDFLDKVEEGEASSGKSYRSIKDFQTEERYVLLLNGFEQAEYTIFYRKNFTQFTLDTKPTFEVELDADKEHLLSLLAAWYVWAEDEPNKATRWRNDYEAFAAARLQAPKVQTAQAPFFNDLGW